MSKKQEMVNKNLEQVFDLPTSTVSNKMANIIRADPMKNNQIQAEEPTPKKKGRGGARVNSGRKVGSTNKITAATLLAEISKCDVPFEQGLAEDYMKARQSGDLQLVQRYQQMFLGKLLAEKTETDITSNGQTVGANFSFPSVELQDWQNEQQPTKH